MTTTTMIDRLGAVQVGDRVQVVSAEAQRKVRLGQPRFAGRSGVIARLPAGGYPMAYVRLEATSRAAERVECLPFALLELLA